MTRRHGWNTFSSFSRTGSGFASGARGARPLLPTSRPMHALVVVVAMIMVVMVVVTAAVVGAAVVVAVVVLPVLAGGSYPPGRILAQVNFL